MPRDRYNRRPPFRQRRKLFLIATEGEKTEEIYFERFKGDRFHKNIHVNVLPSKKGKSSPDVVRRRLQEYVKKYGVEDNDELWVVVDVDQRGADTLDDLCRVCEARGFNIAVSNPCFEFWLVLHQNKLRTPSSASDCVTELEHHLGRYDKAKYDVERLIAHVHKAIDHARRLDTNPGEKWPHERGTHVYKLVEKLIAEDAAT